MCLFTKLNVIKKTKEEEELIKNPKLEGLSKKFTFRWEDYPDLFPFYDVKTSKESPYLGSLVHGTLVRKDKEGAYTNVIDLGIFKLAYEVGVTNNPTIFGGFIPEFSIRINNGQSPYALIVNEETKKTLTNGGKIETKFTFSSPLFIDNNFGEKYTCLPIDYNEFDAEYFVKLTLVCFLEKEEGEDSSDF